MIKTIYDIPEHIIKTSYQNATIGHVLTPPKLALEMIETLPCEVFVKGIKIFDPACKNGSFLFQSVIKMIDRDFTIKEIESSLYTCDTLNASLNIAESGIKHIFRFSYQNSLVKINNLLYKHRDIELVYDDLIKTISKNKYISIRNFINGLLLDKKNYVLIVEFEKNLIEFIKRYEGLSKAESKLFGEVFTPQALIEEMLDTLPADVWNNKDLKWLDPAVGIGNFPAAVLQRLMKGLEDVIVDELERRKYILEEMLYMGDISTKNLFLLYQLFDVNNSFKLNVFRGDFLSDKFDKHMKEVWRLDGFDVVVGNPPYSDNNFSGKNNKIYPHFSKKCLNLLKDDGKMLFITPVSATKNNQRFSLIGLNGLSIVDFSSNKYFNNVGVDICYWYVDRNGKKDELLVITDNGKYYDKITNQVFDTSKLDKNILDIIEGIKEITLNDISKRMFRQNNFQPDVMKDKNDLYVNPLYEKIDKIYGYIKAVPYHFNKNKIIIPFSKKLKGNIFNTKKDFNQNWLCSDVNNDIEFENIKSFILSEYFIHFVSIWKKMDGYGFSNAIKYLPEFDKSKRWDNEKVKLFLESFKK
jgi:hypothetical protein